MFENVIGKMVCLTGNNEVGLGTEGKPIKGRVLSVDMAGDTVTFPLEHEGIENSATYKLNAATATAGGGTAGVEYVATVEFGKIFDGVAISATAAKQPAAGDVCAVDGAGGVVKGTITADSVLHHSYADSVDTASRTASVVVM